MAAWHGADHLMVIRTTGQSHIDGLMEGTPEGTGGVPITRKQIRATRKALRPHRGRGRPPAELPQLRLRRGRPRDRRAVRRGGHERRPPGPAVQRALPQRRHVPLLRRRGRGQARDGRGGDLPDRRRPQRQRHGDGRLAGDARAARPARHQLRLLGRRRHAQGADRPLDGAARRRPGPEALVRPALRRRAARLLLRLQDARAAEHALHRGRRRGGGPQPHDRHPDLDPHQRGHPEHDHARRGPQRAVALQQHPRRPDRQADLGGAGRRQGAAVDQDRRPAGRDGARHQGARGRLPGGGARGRRLLRRRRAGLLRRLGPVPGAQRRRHRPRRRERRGGAHDRAARSGLHGAGLRATSARTTCPRAWTSRATRSAAARSATRRRSSTSTSSIPRTRRPPARGDPAVSQGRPHPARGRVGRRRDGAGAAHDPRERGRSRTRPRWRSRAGCSSRTPR